MKAIQGSVLQHLDIGRDDVELGHPQGAFLLAVCAVSKVNQRANFLLNSLLWQVHRGLEMFMSGSRRDSPYEFSKANVQDIWENYAGTVSDCYMRKPHRFDRLVEKAMDLAKERRHSIGFSRSGRIAAFTVHEPSSPVASDGEN